MLQPGMQIRGYRVLRPLGKGGFCQTFEVEIAGESRVLKVLTQDYPKAIALFQREARVLSRLRHPGIPRVEANGYFVILGQDAPRHCLVMEKIPGTDLNQWLVNRNHQPVSASQAMDWLRQLSEILKLIHQQQCFHRDIKPANIMLKPNGQVVLIDFGAVRELTESYLADQVAQRTGSTHLQSRGYTPPEQLDGQAVPQSDFFALGRTFVHLLTGKAPYCFRIDATGQLLWRQAAPHAPAGLADLLDYLMARFPSDRPQTAEGILDALNDLGAPGSGAATWTQRCRRWWRSRPDRIQQRAIALAVSLTTAIGILGVRATGALEPLELRTWDHLMQMRPVEPPDPRLLIVTIDEADIQAQDGAGMVRRGSLADQTLAELLVRLESASLVGLDIYRDFPVAADLPQLQARLARDPRWVTLCKRPSAIAPGIASPPESPPEQVGFSDFLEDQDGVLRRHLLFLTPEAESAPVCPAAYSFSAQLALRYLAQQGIEPNFGEEAITLGEATFPFLTPQAGGYHHVDAAGGQVLLNYRATPSLGQVAEQVTLTALLSGQVAEGVIRDRIVLIGVTAASASDYWRTPYRTEASHRIPGVYAQAHMISQMISAALDNRPLLWVWPRWGEVLYIVGICFLGGWVANAFRKTLLSLGAIGIVLLAVYTVAWGMLLQGAWLPLLPSLLGVVLSAAGIHVCRRMPIPGMQRLSTEDRFSPKSTSRLRP